MRVTVEQYRKLSGGEKRVMSHEESLIQQSCVSWFNVHYPQYCLFSVKNSAKFGGKTIKGRNGKEVPMEAVIASREGLKAGIADLQLLHGNNDYHSLFMEVKKEKGVQSKKQKEFEEYCKGNGYKYVIIRSLSQFIEVVNEYVKIKTNCV